MGPKCGGWGRHGVAKPGYGRGGLTNTQYARSTWAANQGVNPHRSLRTSRGMDAPTLTLYVKTIPQWDPGAGESLERAANSRVHFHVYTYPFSR